MYAMHFCGYPTQASEGDESRHRRTVPVGRGQLATAVIQGGGHGTTEADGSEAVCQVRILSSFLRTELYRCLYALMPFPEFIKGVKRSLG